MKSFYVHTTLDRRIPYQEYFSEGILAYDYDNLYPQRVKELAGRSSACTSALDLYDKFIRGNGFEDQNFNKALVNSKRQRVSDILRLVANDLAHFRGFAIRVNYNAFLEIHSIYHIPFEFIRLGLPDQNGAVNYVRTYNDWAEEKANLRKNVQKVYRFNDDPDTIRYQIKKSGGMQGYRGQIFYYIPDSDTYPVASFDAIINDVDTDARISRFKNRNVRNKFMPSTIGVYPGELEEESRSQLINNVQNFQGDENAGSVMILETGKKDLEMKFEKFDVQNTDKIFEFHETSTKETIREHYKQPAILAGKVVPGKLGGSAEYRDAMEIYNMIISDERHIISESFRNIFSNFASEINPSGNYNILPKQFG